MDLGRTSFVSGAPQGYMDQIGILHISDLLCLTKQLSHDLKCPDPAPEYCYHPNNTENKKELSAEYIILYYEMYINILQMYCDVMCIYIYLYIYIYLLVIKLCL